MARADPILTLVRASRSVTKGSACKALRRRQPVPATVSRPSRIKRIAPFRPNEIGNRFPRFATRHPWRLPLLIKFHAPSDIRIHAQVRFASKVSYTQMVCSGLDRRNNNEYNTDMLVFAEVSGDSDHLFLPTSGSVRSSVPRRHSPTDTNATPEHPTPRLLVSCATYRSEMLRASLDRYLQPGKRQRSCARQIPKVRPTESSCVIRRLHTGPTETQYRDECCELSKRNRNSFVEPPRDAGLPKLPAAPGAEVRGSEDVSVGAYGNVATQQKLV